MADTGWKFGSAINAIRGSGTILWLLANNVLSDGANTGTNFTSVNTPGSTYFLGVTGFDFSSIPAGSTIDGVSVRVGDYARTSLGGAWNAVRLILADDSDGSENKATEYTGFGVIPTTDENNSTSDLWSETLAVTDVQDADFGCQCQVFSAAIETTSAITINYIQMRVDYTEAPAGTNTTIIVPTGPARS